MPKSLIRFMLSSSYQNFANKYHFFKYLQLLSILICFIGIGQARAQVELEPAFPFLTFLNPLDLQHSGDGTNRLFVVEQRGMIHVFENSQYVTEHSIFLDIRDRVNDEGFEEGLLGLAFHPDYENNGYFFVDYTASNPMRTVISRYSVSVSNPDSADENSEFIIMEFSQPFENHNAGQISFGSDGYLYISAGDGGSGGDPFGNGQNLQTLLGSLLRVDINSPAGGMNYDIPPDNPFFANDLGYREEIFAYGLRNPWRFSFDPLTGWLWLADVGQDEIEEIDLIYIGRNYGWNVMEGNRCFDPSTGCDTTGLELPIWEYDHSLGLSVTGGFVYHGSNAPEFEGHYIYADYLSGRIWSLFYDGENPPSNTELMDTDLFITSFGIDENNELYICAFDGTIYWFSGGGPEFWNWDIAVTPGYGLPERDSVIVTASPIEPAILSLFAEFELPDKTPLDTLQLFDDGNHYDGDSGDGLFGNAWRIPSVEEGVIFVDIIITLVDTDTISFEIDNATRFTTIGPIVYDSHEIIFNNGSLLFFDLNLTNLGISSTASNVRAELSSSDSCVTDINTGLFSFGDIAAGETAISAGRYSFEINQNCVGDELLTFDLAVSSNGIPFWSDNFEIQLEPVGVNNEHTELPTEYFLSEPYPNPFNPTTSIEYSLPLSGEVSLIIYNLLGQEVAKLVNGDVEAGYHKVRWNASNVSSGIYLYRLRAGDFFQTRKMVLLK